ncbi:MAG: hypothetical protein A2644_00415 [Candidatus Zambryskibacteria bacterium RIFCSPHIGHO2_01_FULL_39_63]|nr:MAG: hypothetical protein A2644_00415 [Candidatus Zambryskibacteria bacterium RIFCSPHIGHO2_01_FULL_39_63]
MNSGLHQNSSACPLTTNKDPFDPPAGRPKSDAVVEFYCQISILLPKLSSLPSQNYHWANLGGCRIFD